MSASAPVPAPPPRPGTPVPGPPGAGPGLAAGPPPRLGPPLVADAPGAAETGHAAVDAALARLDGLAEVPTEAHAALFEGVHEQLRQTLAALDQPRP
ncbi:hypothetical protein GXW83_25005 [Streptacidiphilus sp. PB12-B1b]|nr:hypothetical protein GXW83_25005 [Streptacidiphilus sp. PB12-B1b]